MRLSVVVLFCFISVQAFSQSEDGFPFGKVTYDDLEMTAYPKDTSAAAVVLNEFGQAYIDNDNDHNLLFDYHVKIKILKTQGLQYADVRIPLYQGEKNRERLVTVKASSFNLLDGKIVESEMATKTVFTEDYSKNIDLKKFAIPNVRVGSVIEFTYTLESPYLHNFRSWEFQSDIPKVQSEYWAKIPGNYIYNITLKGFLTLTKNESELVKGCFTPGGGNTADCVLFKYGMKNIPAFVEEDLMTARSNFLSAINFELSEIRFFDGRVDKITKEWRDVEIELRRHPEFGGELKKADRQLADIIALVVAAEADENKRARKVYDYIKDNFQWDGKNGMFTEKGVKATVETKSGNVADINFLLIGALQAAGFDAFPIILSTRANGLPREVHPVISDFNYVIAGLMLGNKQMMLDATDPFLPFGLLPERCLNGKGRAVQEKNSFWTDLLPSEKARKVANLSLKLDQNGAVTGTLQTTLSGYEALRQRKEIAHFNETKEYIEDLNKKLDGIEITGFDIQNFATVDKSLVMKYELKFQLFDEYTSQNFLFNPFLFDRQKVNPFKSEQRLYPVDFGSPREITTILNLEFPEAYEIVNSPERVALLLPNSGGRYIFEANLNSNHLTLSNSLLINRTVFSSSEYQYLRELYSRIIQTHNEDLIFKKKL